MAYYSIFPEKDTTLYSHPDRINMNTGKDEALELVEEKATTGEIYYPSRIGKRLSGYKKRRTHGESCSQFTPGKETKCSYCRKLYWG